MKRTLLEYLVFVVAVTAAIHANSQELNLKFQQNGFVLDNDQGLPPRLVLGIGDTEQKFALRNPSFAEYGHASSEEPLVIPILAKTISTYQDGELEYEVGCSFTTDIYGKKGEEGIWAIEYELCNPSIDDWESATRELSAQIESFRKAHPKLEDLAVFRKTHSLSEAEAAWGGILSDRITKIDFPITEKIANKIFEQDASAGNPRELKLHQNTYLVLAVLRNDRVIVSFGISKERFGFDGNGPESEVPRMKYVKVVTFSKRPSTR